jgi:elongation factor G
MLVGLFSSFSRARQIVLLTKPVFAWNSLAVVESSTRLSKSQPRYLRRFSSTTASLTPTNLERTRNIGIIAHIDAGKTTTTERMLYYSGFTRTIGDVDDGSTVTDFLPAERARGITIQSAAITLNWPPQKSGESESFCIEDLEAKGLPRSAVSHTINLIDTPGHADFTFEVLRSLRILDGAVCILDGVAGVEAQTERVWHQANTYCIPRIVYINKLDRDGAAFGKTVREVGLRLQGWPALCQIPWFKGGNGRFTGVADVVFLRGLLWEGGDGKAVKIVNLKMLEELEGQLAQELKKARIALVELLSEHDEVMVEKFLESEGDHLAVSPNDILSSLRRCLLQQENRLIPIFAGASFRNMGVQPLLDAIINLLPSPTESPEPEVSIDGIKGGLQRLLNGDLITEHKQKASTKIKQKKKGSRAVKESSIEKLESCALAFKVVSDAKRGALVYVRVYSGSLDRNCFLYNTNLSVTERAHRLLKMYANEAVEVESIPAGHIGVVVGLKHARTGDTLISYAGGKSAPPEPLNALQLRPIDVPPPVFFASIEPQSLQEEKSLRDALALLLREDPSLHVTVDEDSGQTLLSGMGELHLEIARDRLVNDFKAKASMGRIEIGYRECPLGRSSPVTSIFDREIAGRKGKAGCTAIVEPLDLAAEQELPKDVIFTESRDGNQVVIRSPGLTSIEGEGLKVPEDTSVLPPHLNINAVGSSLYHGCLAALARGPQFSYPIHSAKVTLIFDISEHLFGGETSMSALSAAARLATQSAIKDLVTTKPNGGTALMEPVMNVLISVDEGSLGSVVHDISSARGGHIVALDEDISSTPQSMEEAPAIDITKIYAPPDPFGTLRTDMSLPSTTRHHRTIAAKVPLREMVGYLKHLRSLTGGRGTFVMNVDRFEKIAPQRQKAILADLANIY